MMQQSSAGGSSGYRPEIDGLRAVAVVPVILFHAGIGAFRGGFVGVDVFFVISGFLITRIIVADLEAGTFSIARFYERRARRILPALFLVLAVCSVLAWAWMVPSQLKLFARSLVAVSLFASNVLLARTAGYFADAAEENPLLHTWSLGVEEQFYLLFPVLLPWAWRRGGVRRATWMVGLLGCASLVLAVWGARSYPRENFFLAPPRAWELMIGALLALLAHRRPLTDYVGRAGRQGLAMVGLGLVGAAIAIFDEGDPFPSEYALVPTLGAALIIAFAERSTLVGRVLSHSWVVGVGLVSYSAYLWHQPLFAFARIVTLDRVSTPAMLLLALLSLPLAILSWRYVETPFRARGLVPRRTVFGFAAAGSVMFASAGLARYLADRDDHLSHAKRMNVGLGLACVTDGGFVLRPECTTSPAPHVLVWGDSFAMHLMPGMVAADSTLGVAQATMSSCGPFLDVAPISKRDQSADPALAQRCLQFNRSVLDQLRRMPSVRIVVLASPFEQYVDSARFTLLTPEGPRAATPAVAASYLRSTIAAVRRTGRKVVLVAPPPAGGFDMGACVERTRLRKLIIGPLAACDFDRGRYLAARRPVLAMLDAVAPDVGVLRFDDVLCGASTCATEVAGVSIYRDAGHLSYAGSEYLGRRMAIARQVERLAR